MSEIVHKAIVIDIKDQLVVAQMSRGEACSSCALKEACGQTTSSHKVIVKTENSKQYNIGQKIEVVISQSQALYAAFWGYVLPLVLVLFTLFIVYTTSQNEELSAMASLGVLVMYYTLLWIFKAHFQKKLQIRIR